MTTILDQAASIVDADREKTYGKPDKNLRAIAEFSLAARHRERRAKLKSQTEP